MAERSVRRVYGLHVAFDPPFGSHLPPADAEPDLAFALAASPPPAPAGLETVWESPEQGAGGEPQTRLQRRAGGDLEVLFFPDVGAFHLQSGRITAFPRPGVAPECVELRLLGAVLAYWLERLRRAVLHASAVVIDGRAVVFPACNHGGKSTLAAALMEQGHALLSDDLLPVAAVDASLLAWPGAPYLRFWPGEAQRFTGTTSWPAVVPGQPKLRVPVGRGGIGRFHRRLAPLAAILIPQRGGAAAKVALRPVSPVLAALHLVRCSYLPRLVVGAGLQPARLELLAEVVERVPVCHLVYPSGYAGMSEVGRLLGSL